jgi:hypothetical protein
MARLIEFHSASLAARRIPAPIWAWRELFSALARVHKLHGALSNDWRQVTREDR